MSDSSQETKARVQQQFGAHAAKYVTSKLHAKGYSLQRLVEVVQPQSDWRVLDVATGGGHTAFAFAPHVAEVVASDLTPQMLEAAAGLGREKGLTNIRYEPADAEGLPFEDGRFDLVTCRIAPHHFPDIGRFLAESARVLRPGGRLAVVDNIVPEDEAAAAHVNAYETLRDPSHARCLPLSEWLAGYEAAGFTVFHHELIAKRVDFEPWVARLNSSPADTVRLREMLVDGPETAVAHFAALEEDGRLFFHLTEALIVGRLA